MARNGIFYLSRVVKGGRLSPERFLEVLAKPKPIFAGDHGWTITDYQASEDGTWHFGKLTKYKPEGAIAVLDGERNVEIEQREPNLIVASSPFVYIPEFAGLAYLQVWNNIERTVFPKRFVSIVQATMDDFFVHCTVEPIGDLRTFVRKLKELDVISEMSARVRPTNPLYSPLWQSLREYIAKRKASTVKVEEQAENGALVTQLPAIAARIAEGLPLPEPGPEGYAAFPIGDAALLMAADGYGTGRVTGRKGKDRVVVHTSQSQKNFDMSPDADPAALGKRTLELLDEIAQERSLVHAGDTPKRRR